MKQWSTPEMIVHKRNDVSILSGAVPGMAENSEFNANAGTAEGPS